MKKTLLFAALIAFLMPSSVKSQILFSETFSTNSLPAGWSNDSLGLPASHLWIFDNFYNRNITGLFLDSHFAIFDSDQGGLNDGFNEDAALTSPSINISTATSGIFLEFDEQLRGVTGVGGGLRMVEMSTDNGATWITIDSTQDDLGYPNPANHSIYDISSAVGSSTLKVRFHYMGSWDWWWAIDNVTVISKPACTNPVNAGTTTSYSASVCPNEEFWLFLSGDDQVTDLTYQWQVSPDAINWTDILGLTTNLELVSQTTASYYRCAITCSGQTAYSIYIFMPMSAPSSCYCIGDFADGCDILDKVVFNTLSNIGSGCNGNVSNYINYPDTGAATTTVYADSTYTLTIASGLGSGTHGAAAWFDFNHDGDFQDADEFFYISDIIPESSADFNINVTIPTTAFGTTRMRVRYIYNNLISVLSDCIDYGYGETEDYTIHVLNPSISVGELNSDNINIYPSPVTSLLNIHTGIQSGNINVNLYDGLGRFCLSKSIVHGDASLNVANLSRGMYFLRITNGKDSIVKKVVLD